MKYTVLGHNVDNEIISLKFDNYNEAKLMEYELSLQHVEYNFKIQFQNDLIVNQLMSRLLTNTMSQDH